MLRFRWHKFLIAEIHRNHQAVLCSIVGIFKAKLITQRFYQIRQEQVSCSCRRLDHRLSALFSSPSTLPHFHLAFVQLAPFSPLPNIFQKLAHVISPPPQIQHKVRKAPKRPRKQFLKYRLITIVMFPHCTVKLFIILAQGDGQKIVNQHSMLQSMIQKNHTQTRVKQHCTNTTLQGLMQAFDFSISKMSSCSRSDYLTFPLLDLSCARAPVWSEKWSTIK